jgi:sulfate adenylyltransferase subunit 1
VQLVIRPQSAAGEDFRDYRGYAGQIASGLVRVGDAVTVQPSGRTSTVTGIDFAGKELTEAFAPQSVTLRLEDDIDISRGDLIVTSRSVPPVTQDIDGTIAWLAEGSLVPGTKVLLKHGTRTVQAMVKTIGGKLDLDDARLLPAESLGLNDIGHVTLRLAAPIPAEEYLHARGTGAFLLIDAQDGGTLAAGMVGDALLDTKAAMEAIGDTTLLV